ncbi:MAG: hypothetical protein K6T75_06725 [Acetobacteraceae bacterium]|nr:hypothetical protein [Acetobacteraceae bacterium]
MPTRAARALHRILHQRAGIKPGEHVLIVADRSTERQLLKALVWSVEQLGAVYTVLVQPDAGWDPVDRYALTPPAREAYPAADLVIAVTRSSSAALYGRPQEFRDLMEARSRVRMLSLCERSLKAVMADRADYAEISRVNQRLKEIFRSGRRLRLRSPAGTDLEAALQPIDYERLWARLSHEGWALEPGAFGAVPDGEVHIPPPPASINGVVVVDGPVANICQGGPDRPITVLVEAGRIKGIGGGRDARRLKEFIDSLDQGWISEVGVGTNPFCRRASLLHVAKKALGSAHVAYGGWWGFQADIPYRVHGDMVIRRAELEVDGRQFLAGGRLLLD